MRSGKLEIDEFGPLGYVLAHQVARAEAVAAFAGKDGKPATYWASLVTYPAYGLRKAGIDPDKDIKALYAGSHTASYEALYNHKVDAGELNSEQLQSATQRGHYKDGDLIFLWKSDPIPTDPITVRGDLPPEFKARVTEALQTLDQRNRSETMSSMHSRLNMV